jgi:cytochrome c oxidase accessory protein FixG
MVDRVVSLYKSEKKIYPREIQGNYAKWRWFFVWVTQIIFYLTPWITWGGRQAILFDIASRRFYIFKYVLYPQDLIYLTALLIISALALFLFTAIAGRVWCGFACPQTVYTEIFLWIEARIEGNFRSREKLDKSKMSVRKAYIKSTKHTIWILFSLWTGYTFVGYFTPIKPLFFELFGLTINGWPLFWVIFYGFLTYFNAGFMREQICKYMCPYARFQNSMLDKDSLIITYDKDRGEPRKCMELNYNGDCINCNICVQVCPNGVDIRDGLQNECLFCGLCIDACNSVMTKINKPLHLISYSAPFILQNKSNFFRMKKFLRPRVLIYSLILCTMTTYFVYKLMNRYDFKFDVVRDRGVLHRVDQYGMLENVYRIKIMNAELTGQEYKLGVDGLPRIRIDDSSLKRLNIRLDSTETDWYIVTVEIPDGSLAPNNYPIHFLLRKEGSNDIIFEDSIFMVPEK